MPREGEYRCCLNINFLYMLQIGMRFLLKRKFQFLKDECVCTLKSACTHTHIVLAGTRVLLGAFRD